MGDLPTGTVSFLFTDIEGSTRLLEETGALYADLLGRHNELIRAAIRDAGGIEVAARGDGFFVVFTDASAAVKAAVAAQRSITATWGSSDAQLRVRMGIHTGEGTLGGDDYVGLGVNRAARIADAAHGQQILVSGATFAAVRAMLPGDVAIRDLGEHWLRDLDHPEPIFQLVVDGLPSDFPPIRAAAGRPHNLPAALSPFLGRDAELAAVADLLGRARLVTLIGPGGTGKTRLAIRAAEQLVNRFPDGVVFVPLASLRDAGLIPNAVAAALGLRLDPALPPSDAVRRHLLGRRMLLVLDNLEQLPSAGPWLADLLRDVAELHLLATSRSPLHVVGEQHLPVPPMRLPAPGMTHSPTALAAVETVALFVARAREVDPAFTLTDQNVDAVAAICERLDGLPLAIELAAARIRVLPPAAMLERLGHPLAVLTSSATNLPERQRTLRGAIAWSYELLQPPEQELFRRLSVFTGGCTLEAAEAVAEGLSLDALDGIESLVDSSLIRSSEREGLLRFTILETIREFAEEQLERVPTDSDVARRRHAEHMLDIAQKAAPEVERSTDAALRLAGEADNLRAALTWSIGKARAPELGMRIAAALGRYWALASPKEGSAWLARAIERIRDEPDELQAALYHWSGVLLDGQHLSAGAEACFTESLVRHRRLGDRAGEAKALNSLGVVARSLGALDRAQDLLEQSLAIRREIDPDGVSTVLSNLGVVAIDRGDLDAARGHLDLAIELSRRAGDLEGEATGVSNLAEAYLRSGDADRAEPMLHRSLAIFQRLGDLYGVAEDLERLAEVAAHRGRMAGAARLLGAGAAIRDAEGLRRPEPDEERYAVIVGQIQAALSAPAFEAAYREGRELRRDVAVMDALSRKPG